MPPALPGVGSGDPRRTAHQESLAAESRTGHWVSTEAQVCCPDEARVGCKPKERKGAQKTEVWKNNGRRRQRWGRNLSKAGVESEAEGSEGLGSHPRRGRAPPLSVSRKRLPAGQDQPPFSAGQKEGVGKAKPRRRPLRLASLNRSHGSPKKGSWGQLLSRRHCWPPRPPPLSPPSAPIALLPAAAGTSTSTGRVPVA